MIELTKETVGAVKSGMRVWFRVGNSDQLRMVQRVTPSQIVTDSMGIAQLRFRKTMPYVYSNIGERIGGSGRLVGIALPDEITEWKARQQSLVDARADEMQRREERTRQCEELRALFTSAVIHEDSENRWTVEFAGLSAQQVRDLAARV
jgi:hypothetical protein